MRAAIYCRVSTASQEDGTSLETQEASCRALAHERGWTVTGVYRDVFTGAELFDRPELGRLRETVRRREVDVVVAHALDRLTRNQAHLGVILSEADYAGVAVELVTEKLEDTPEGRLLQSVRGFVAEVERLKIAERTVRGRKARAQTGKLLPGKAALYGYRWRDADKGRLAIDPVHGPIVRRIFREVAMGATIRGVALRLSAEGIPTPSGGDRWSPSTLYTILTRRAYLGEAVAWRYGSEKIKGGRWRVLARPEHERIALPSGTIPPLVEEPVFDSVQQILARNRAQATRNNRHPEATLLRGGYARCGACDTTLNATTKRSGVFYRHSTRARDRHGCPPLHIKADRLDVDVWQRVRTILTQPDLIADELARSHEEDGVFADLAAIDHRLAQVARKQGNLVRRLAMIDDEDTASLVATEINALSGEKRQLEAERVAVEARVRARQQVRDQLADLEAWCRRVSTNLDALDYAERRQILDALGVQVRLYNDDHILRFEMTASLPLDGTDIAIVSTAPRACAASACSSGARPASPA
ncbi:MAG: recombinase family protein [Thermomicrobiales bacterium]|nr:recombinase family protein [Thermomicrobiales bacterium]